MVFGLANAILFWQIGRRMRRFLASFDRSGTMGQQVFEPSMPFSSRSVDRAGPRVHLGDVDAQRGGLVAGPVLQQVQRSGGVARRHRGDT